MFISLRQRHSFTVGIMLHNWQLHHVRDKRRSGLSIDLASPPWFGLLSGKIAGLSSSICLYSFSQYSGSNEYLTTRPIGKTAGLASSILIISSSEISGSSEYRD